MAKESMIKSVDTIILLVNDIDMSVSFYKDALGLSLKFKSPGWAEIVVGDIHLALHRKSSELTDKSDALSTIGVSINFEVENIDRILAHLDKRNIDIVGQVKEYEFGRYFFVTDPDGYIVGFREYRLEQTAEASS